MCPSAPICEFGGIVQRRGVPEDGTWLQQILNPPPPPPPPTGAQVRGLADMALLVHEEQRYLERLRDGDRRDRLGLVEMRRNMIEAQNSYLRACDSYARQKEVVSASKDAFGEDSLEHQSAKELAGRKRQTKRSQKHRLGMFTAEVTERQRRISALELEISQVTHRLRDFPVMFLTNLELLHLHAEALRVALREADADGTGVALQLGLAFM